MKQNIRLMLLDDQKIFLDSLKMALELEQRFSVVVSSTDSKGVVNMIDQHGVEILIMDIVMPDRSGLLVFEEVRKQRPDIKIIGMSGLMQIEAFVSLWNQKINGLVHKNEELDVLKSAIVSVQENRRYLSGLLCDKIEDHEKSPAFSSLSKREKQVLTSIAAGQTNKEIATSLGINVATVRTHRENMMSKIDAHSSAEIIRFAMKSGLMGDLTPAI